MKFLQTAYYNLVIATTLLVSSSSAAEFVEGTKVNTVIALEGANFKTAIKDPANPFWFLKFYAPWCGHCKRMAPVLDKVAPKLEGKMAIGKIDCTVHKALCSEYKVRGFPTLMYSMDGAMMEYSGGREESDLINFAHRMSGPAVHVVKNYEEAVEYAAKETSEGVAFLGFDPNSKVSEMTQLHQIFNQVARKKQASAYFLWLVPGEEERNYQFIHKVEANIQPRSYEDRSRDITKMTTDSLMAWVDANNVPLVAEIGAGNFNSIGRKGRPLALSILDYGNAEQKKAIKEHLLAYAASLPDKEAEKYYFGIMDGTKWAKFLSQFNIKKEDNPQMLIMDVPSKKFYQNETYQNVVDFMNAVKAGEIEERAATKPKKDGILGMIESLFLDNFPYSLIVLLCLVFGLVFLLVPSDDNMRPPYDGADEFGDIIGDDDVGAEPSSEPKKEK